ncbi:hypothetical protein [Geminocystis herdmanii]|nr:hypothetical protein [Geminocystis herdmanii]
MSRNHEPQILIDTGILVAFYSVNDKYHNQVIDFFLIVAVN